MRLSTVRTKGLLVATVLLLSIVPTALLHTGDASECVPACDDCHDYHDRVYNAYLDITRFDVPAALNGTDVGVAEVQVRLHGNVGLGYTTVRRGHLTLSANNDRVGIEFPKQEFISMEPGFYNFRWNVSGRLPGTDTMHVEVYALGVHLSVEFFESADSGPVVVTNPVNAAPRVTILQPDGYNDVATNSFTLELNIQDPNNDPMLADYWWDDDRNRKNGTTIIQRSVMDPETYVWDTRSLPNGWYYIHVDVDDQMGGRDSATSYFPVIVSHGNRVPNVELVSPVQDGTVHDPVMTFTWRGEDLDGDALTYEVWVGRDLDYMEMVGTTTQTFFKYAADDNARLFWTIVPDDGKVRGWCKNGPRRFSTNIEYPVEVDLVLPADGSVVPGPDVKLVWYGRDRDFEQVFYSVWLEHGGEVTQLARRWDDPAGPVLIVRELVPGETYTWWVEGDNPYSPKGTSQKWNFTIATKGLPVAQLMEESVEEGSVTLQWTASPEGSPPDHYDLHLVDPEEGDRVLLEGTLDTSYVLRDLREDTTYHWYVIPFDAGDVQGHSTPTYRTFTYDANTPPTVSIDNPYLELEPGPFQLEWTGHDVDSDPMTFDVYMDDQNATTLVAANVSEQRLQVTLQPSTTYRWRVTVRDAMSVGGNAIGVIVAGAGGSDVVASGRLLTPEEGATVPAPVVNLSWEAEDPLDRTLLYDLYVDLEGGDPLDLPPLTANATNPWFLIELEPGNQVSWAVEVHPVRGPVSLLGVASFSVTGDRTELPVALLSVDGQPAGSGAEVVALEVVTLDGNASTTPIAGDLLYMFDFGDGTASGWVKTPAVEHTYLKEGSYNASLTVRDDDGLESEAHVVLVTVAPGDTSSDEDVPAPGGAMGAIAMALAAMMAAWERRRRERGGGRR